MLHYCGGDRYIILVLLADSSSRRSRFDGVLRPAYTSTREYLERRVVELLLLCHLIVYVIRAHIGAYVVPLHSDALSHSALLHSKQPKNIVWYCESHQCLAL